MRIKDLWLFFPLPAKLRLFWDRITLTRTTTIYFVFSVVHCLVQVFFQLQAFHINAKAADFLSSVIQEVEVIDPNAFYVFGNDLRLCHGVPTSFSTRSCQVIWDGIVENNTVISTIGDTSTTLTTPNFRGKRDTRIPHGGAVKRNNVATINVNGEVQVIVDGFKGNESAILDTECLGSLGWPVQSLRNNEREDVTIVAFQIWVFGMSVVAILNESVPHMIATLLTHLVATGWAGYQIFGTMQFHKHFTEVTTNGACHPIDLLSAYWRSRSDAQMLCLILNATALIVSTSLSWILSKAFVRQTFKRVGASLLITRIYNVVLMLSIIIQLSLFFIITSIALWLDQLWNGSIAHMASKAYVYRPVSILILILLPLWLSFGWYSVRRERRVEMLMFLVMCLGYLAGWGAMFNSATFRWTYVTWAFFGVMMTSSVFLTFLAFILGIICRLNFGKGLPQYLDAQEPLDGDFEPVVIDEAKRLSGKSAPTSSVTFGPSCARAAQIPARIPELRFTQPTRLDIQTFIQQPSPVVVHFPSDRGCRGISQQLEQSRDSVASSSEGSKRSVENEWWI